MMTTALTNHAASAGLGHSRPMTWGNNVDAYATKVLQMESEAVVDDSLGPYITSILRCAELEDPKKDLASLEEFEALLELLEDQCSMEPEVAKKALGKIAEAVCTGVVPQEGTSASLQGGLYAGEGLDSFQKMRDSLPRGGNNLVVNTSIASATLNGMEPYTPNSTGGPSPLKPDNLIPIDLLGVLDNPSPHMSRHVGQVSAMIQAQQRRTTPNFPSLTPGTNRTPVKPVTTGAAAAAANTTLNVPSSDEAFPPLGPSSTNSKPKKAKGKKGRNSSAHSDKELAAALFRPARPRQNSITSTSSPDEASSPQMQPATEPTPAADLSQNPPSWMQQQQWKSCIEILLSMNPELSEESAAEAATLAQADINVAQYIVDAAITAPPVCRHMLHDGCYRSDCQFSHDVDGHTCLFWMRGRCGKANCKFLHGFHKKLMDGLDQAMESANNSQDYGNPYPSESYQPDGFGGFPLSSQDGMEAYPMAGSWQTASPMTKQIPVSSVATPSPGSFANIASRGYDSNNKTYFASPAATNAASATPPAFGNYSTALPTARIPQDLWNPHENRDASVFYITNPLERYHEVAKTQQRADVLDLHFQSTKSFPVVMQKLLPEKLQDYSEVWVVTGTGHHVGTKTHQKGGGALEQAVLSWLVEEGYNVSRGKDRNGLGGALLVKR